MDQNFQTSFIPKKPIMEERVRSSSSSVGLFMIASIFVFFTVLLGSAGLYFYKNSLMVQLTTMKTDLNLAKNRFEPTAINKLQILDKRLNAGTEILSKHIAISPIFKAIESVTIKNIRYSKFTYSLADTNKIEVKMTGQAIGYRSVALQADLLSKNKYFIDPVFSNLSLDSKGNVLFDLSFSVDPSLVGYKQMLETSSNSSEVSQVNVEATN
jgi:hypothetical protein